MAKRYDHSLTLLELDVEEKAKDEEAHRYRDECPHIHHHARVIDYIIYVVRAIVVDVDARCLVVPVYVQHLHLR